MTFRIKLLFLSLLTVVVIVVLLLLHPISQDPSYHQFADDRSLWHIPDFANVVSNFLFLLVGIRGLFLLAQTKVSVGIGLTYGALFAGILLTGLGSAYYHLHPDNNSLVYDRLPMTLVFMALLSATISERIDPRLGFGLLGPLLVLGAGSVIWWHYTEVKGHGDLRLYVFVQYYPILLIPSILLLFPATSISPRTAIPAIPATPGTVATPATPGKEVRLLVWAVIWYIIAKLFDLFDRPIFSLLGSVSGHTLKHIAAAIATWYLVKMFQQKYRAGQ
jgi:Ceramidase